MPITKIKEKYKIISMSYSRSEFKNKVEEKVGGAFYEYLKASYAKVNKKTKWVTHWNQEVTRLLDSELIIVLLHSATFKNKIKAATEVVNEIKKLQSSYKASAKKQLESNYFKMKLNDIPDKLVDDFFARVELIIHHQIDDKK